MIKVSSLNSIKELRNLAELQGLLLKEPPPISVVDTDKSAQNLQAALKAKDIVRVSRETKGRGGKAVTLVKGVSLAGAPLDLLGKQLKTACGSGGTVKEGVIEVQGDHVDRVVMLLVEQGYKAKKSGG